MFSSKSYSFVETYYNIARSGVLEVGAPVVGLHINRSEYPEVLDIIVVIFGRVIGQTLQNGQLHIRILNNFNREHTLPIGSCKPISAEDLTRLQNA